MASKIRQKRAQNWIKNGSKTGSSFGLLLDPFWGPFWGPKHADKVSLFWHVFRSGSGASFWPHLGLISPPSWPLLGSSWPHLGPSWPHLGPILASSCIKIETCSSIHVPGIYQLSMAKFGFQVSMELHTCMTEPIRSTCCRIKPQNPKWP